MSAAGTTEPPAVPRRLTLVTGRRRTALLAACLATLVLAVPGCGQWAADGSDGSDGSDSAADQAAGATSPGTGGDEAGGAALAITAVTVRLTGGLSGVDDSTTLTDEADRSGEVFAMAAMLPQPVRGGPAEAPCCDLISYRVTVRFANGDTNTYVTWDGGPAQALLLARAVLKVPNRS